MTFIKQTTNKDNRIQTLGITLRTKFPVCVFLLPILWCCRLPGSLYLWWTRAVIYPCQGVCQPSSSVRYSCLSLPERKQSIIRINTYRKIIISFYIFLIRLLAFFTYCGVTLFTLQVCKTRSTVPLKIQLKTKVVFFLLAQIIKAPQRENIKHPLSINKIMNFESYM